MIADTCLVIDLLRDDERAWAKVAALEQGGEIISIPVFALFELYSGLARSERSADELSRIAALLEDQDILPFETESARIAGQIDGELNRLGTPVGVSDCLIAGIALSRNEPIITRNVKDFKRIKGLAVEPY